MVVVGKRHKNWPDGCVQRRDISRLYCLIPAAAIQLTTHRSPLFPLTPATNHLLPKNVNTLLKKS